MLFPVIRVDVLGDPDDPSNTFEFAGAPEIVVNDWYPVDTPHPNNGDVNSQIDLGSLAGLLSISGSVSAASVI